MNMKCSYVKPPDHVIQSKNREINIFNINGKNIDKKVVDEFGLRPGDARSARARGGGRRDQCASSERCIVRCDHAGYRQRAGRHADVGECTSLCGAGRQDHHRGAACRRVHRVLVRGRRSEIRQPEHQTPCLAIIRPQVVPSSPRSTAAQLPLRLQLQFARLVLISVVFKILEALVQSHSMTELLKL